MRRTPTPSAVARHAMATLALCFMACGPTRPRASTVADVRVDDEADDPIAMAVVQLRGTTQCTGSLVAIDWVLTAAHCVVGLDAFPDVFVGEGSGSGGGTVAHVDRCEIHPDAYGAPTDCLRAPPPHLIERADLAMLHLSNPVAASVARPVALALHAGERAVAQYVGSQVRLVGWHQTAVTMGWNTRWAGGNTIVDANEDGFITLPVVGTGLHGFATRPGDSGGPALLERDGRQEVIGVLSGGANAVSADSMYAWTWRPANAVWIERLLDPARRP